MEVNINLANGRTITAEDPDTLAELLADIAGDYSLRADGTGAERVAFGAMLKAWPYSPAMWEVAEGTSDEQAALIEYVLENHNHNPGVDILDFLGSMESEYQIHHGDAGDWAEDLIANESGGYDQLPAWARAVYADIIDALATQAQSDGTVTELTHDLGAFTVEDLTR